MSTRPERRRVARLTVPRELRGGEPEQHRVHVLNLNPLGARITHRELLREGLVCYVDLPPALGALRLTGRVVWTRLHDTEQTLEGDQRAHYETGIEFLGTTPEQKAALAALVATLEAQAAWNQEASQ